MIRMKGEYKKILFDIFSVLEFTDSEKEKALETFKKKLAFELLNSIKSQLSQDQQDWLNRPAPDVQDVKFAEIQQTVKSMHTEEEWQKITKPIFKNILEDYVAFMSQDLESDKVSRLKEISAGF